MACLSAGGRQRREYSLQAAADFLTLAQAAFCNLTFIQMVMEVCAAGILFVMSAVSLDYWNSVIKTYLPVLRQTGCVIY